MVLGEKHAPAAYIVADDHLGVRLASLDARIDSSRGFKDIRELFSYFSQFIPSAEPAPDSMQTRSADDPAQADGPAMLASAARVVAGPAVVALPVIEPLFGASGTKATPESLDVLRQLSATMYGTGQDGRIPAGYTYLGQFIAHEMCRSVYFDRDGQAQNAATFAIDLDSIYANAPTDGLRLQLGKTTRHDAPFDIRREQSGRPNIANPRNDSNLALSQIHCAIQRFHNALAESGLFNSFESIQEQAALVVQSVVLRDWLVRLTSTQLVQNILSGVRYTDPGATLLCPAEAALAGLRCGHSMVRDRYEAWNGHQATAASLAALLNLTGGGSGLQDGKLPWSWPVHWRDLFNFDDSQGRHPIKAKRIDTIVAEPLEHLDQRLFDVEKQETSLAYRTLSFGAKTQVKDGWSIQALLASKVGAAEFPMQPGQLAFGRPDLQALFGNGGSLTDHPPLWWFILREAELHGVDGGLAGVGARLVAETVIAAIEATTPSILSGALVHPSLPGGGVLPATMSNMLSWGGQPIDWYTTAYNYAN